MMPSRTTMPMASAQVMSGSIAIENATTAFRPRPVAMASGNLATTPIRIDMIPAMSAVAAATLATDVSSSPPRNPPVPSGTVPMMSGFNTTM